MIIDRSMQPVWAYGRVSSQKHPSSGGGITTITTRCNRLGILAFLKAFYCIFKYEFNIKKLLQRYIF